MPGRSASRRAPFLRRVAVPTLRQVGTRTYAVHHYTASQKTFNSESRHYARSAVSALKIAWGNWYVATNASNNPGAGAADGLETNCPTTCTVSVGINYPVGSANWTRLTWDGGSASKAIAPGETAYTDLVALAVPIPQGSQFAVRFFINNLTNVAGIPYLKDSSGATATNTLYMTGDACRSSATMSAMADMSMGGDLTTVGTSFLGLVTPLLILGMSTKPAILLIGDSIQMGYGDTNSAAGDTGIVSRMIGPYYAYANHGVSGDEAFINLTSNAKRTAMARYFTHIVSNYGINDIKTPRTLAEVQAALSALKAAYGGLPLYQTTITPYTTGTFATLGGQTVSADETIRAQTNAWLRGAPANIDGVFDTATSVTDAPTQKWLVSPSAYTIEGLHPTLVALQAVTTAGSITSFAFGS
jgi:hypothetical protein